MTGRFTRLLHLGNVVIDVVAYVPALPERGGDVLASGARLAPGGGFNVLAAAVRQGLPAAYAGGYGTGPLADLALAALREAGVEVLGRRAGGQDTGFVISLVDAAGERTFVTSPGAEAAVTAGDLAQITAGPRDAVYLSGYSLAHPASRDALLDWLSRLGGEVTVFFDPGPLGAGVPARALHRVLRRADWLTCNASEAAGLSGCADPATAAAGLGRRLARPGGVVVRTGLDGCLLSGPDGAVTPVPGFPVRAVDSSGAGDAHAGAFIAALAHGAGPRAAARAANAAAALAVTRPGPATAPTRAELARFLGRQPG